MNKTRNNLMLLVLVTFIGFVTYAEVVRAEGTPYIVDTTTGRYLGNLSANEFDANSVNNEFGTYGNQFNPNSVNNIFGPYGSDYSNTSINNPFATNAPSIMVDE